jgi:hypothetical protein
MKTASTQRAAATPAPAKGLLARCCACGTHAAGECETCRRQRSSNLQRAAIDGHAAAPRNIPPIVQDVLRQPGVPLDAATREFVEPRFGRDFSRVRLHTDERAARSARTVGAAAYAFGDHIVFATDRYAPHTFEGRRLIAHELAHVAQQSYAGPAATPSDAILEREAHEAADAVVRGHHSIQLSAAVPHLSRQIQSRPADPSAAAAELIDKYGALFVDEQALASDLLTLARRGQVATAIAAFDLLEPLVRDNVALALTALASDSDLAKLAETEAGDAFLLRLYRELTTGRVDKDDEAPQAERLERVRAQRPPKRDLAGEPVIRPDDSEEGLGIIQLRPKEGAVRLLQPLTLAEIATEVYGRDSAVRLLRLYNPSLVAGRANNARYPAGTEFAIDREEVVKTYRAFFLASQSAQEQLRVRSYRPYIDASSEDAAVPGSTVNYAIRLPNSQYESASLFWGIAPAPLNATERVPGDLIKEGPHGFISPGKRSENDTWNVTFDKPGTFQILCLVIYSATNRQWATTTQLVMDLEAKTDIAFARDIKYTQSTKQLLAAAKTRREALPVSASRQQRESHDEQIKALEKTLENAGAGAEMNPLKAVYVSSADTPVTIPLTVYVGADPEYQRPGQVHSRYHLKLWDFSQAKPREYTEEGDKPLQTLLDLLETFADDAPYPDGRIRFEISASTLGYSIGVTRRVVTHKTDGGTKIDTIVRGLSAGTFAIGIGAMAFGQAEIGVPALYLSGVLAGVAGSLEVKDRIEHGQFEWDVQTGMNVLEIAAAVATAGAGAAVLRGVGGVTLSSKFATKIGYVQIGVLGAERVSEIKKAHDSGDDQKRRKAIMQAIAEGLLFVVIHKAAKGAAERRRADVLTKPKEIGPTKWTTGPKRAPLKEAPAAAAAPEEVPAPDAAAAPQEIRSTVSGTTRSTRAPRQGAPAASAEDRFVKPGSPEHKRLMHEAWMEKKQKSQMRVMPIATPETVRRREVPLHKETFKTPDEAYRVYDEELVRNGHTQEVGIYRNTQDGSYAVRAGTEFELRGPIGSEWQTVLHFHPNPQQVRTYRLPAPRDVETTEVAAFRAQRPVTEFIEYPLPDGSRGRVAFTVQETPYRLTIQYSEANTRFTKTFNSIDEYVEFYGSRTRALDPKDPLYRWIEQDLDDFYAGRRKEFRADRPSTTMAGTRRPPSSSTETPLEPGAQPKPQQAEAVADSDRPLAKSHEIEVTPAGISLSTEYAVELKSNKTLRKRLKWIEKLRKRDAQGAAREAAKFKKELDAVREQARGEKARVEQAQIEKARVDQAIAKVRGAGGTTIRPEDLGMKRSAQPEPKPEPEVFVQTQHGAGGVSLEEAAAAKRARMDLRRRAMVRVKGDGSVTVTSTNPPSRAEPTRDTAIIEWKPGDRMPEQVSGGAELTMDQREAALKQADKMIDVVNETKLPRATKTTSKPDPEEPEE